jgi:hypothetical protein
MFALLRNFAQLLLLRLQESPSPRCRSHSCFIFSPFFDLVELCVFLQALDGWAQAAEGRARQRYAHGYCQRAMRLRLAGPWGRRPLRVAA